MNTQKKETQELTDTSDGNPPSGTGDFSETKKQTKNIKQEGALLKKPRQLNQKKHQKKIKIPWILTVCLMTIILSFLFGILSQLVIGEIEPPRTPSPKENGEGAAELGRSAPAAAGGPHAQGFTGGAYFPSLMQLASSRIRPQSGSCQREQASITADTSELAITFAGSWSGWWTFQR